MILSRILLGLWLALRGCKALFCSDTRDDLRQCEVKFEAAKNEIRDLLDIAKTHDPGKAMEISRRYDIDIMYSPPWDRIFAFTGMVVMLVIIGFLLRDKYYNDRTSKKRKVEIKGHKDQIELMTKAQENRDLVQLIRNVADGSV